MAMTCNTCGGWGDYPVAGPYPELTITHEPCPECASPKCENCDGKGGWSCTVYGDRWDDYACDCEEIWQPCPACSGPGLDAQRSVND